eukprot:gene10208-11257_t
MGDIEEELTEERAVDFSYEELLEQNKSLSEQLAQCRADKEFVWTLWKRMQAEKPDISSVVSMVVLREKEKSEVKDQKVLEILKEKDNNIRILEEIAADFEVQLKQAMERLSSLLVAQTEWQSEIDQVKAENEKFKAECEYQQEILNAMETQKQNEAKDFTERIEKLDNVNKDSEQRIAELEVEVDKLSKETSVNANVMEANSVLRDKVKILEKDLELTKRECNEKISLLEARERQLLHENDLVHEQREQIELKELENSSLRNEVKKTQESHDECLRHLDEQNDIIRNLELLQDETQQVLKSHQDSHNAEVSSYKNTLNGLRLKCVDIQSTNQKLHSETEVLKQRATFRVLRVRSLGLKQKESLAKEHEIMQLEKTLSEREQKMFGYDSETQTIDFDCPGCRQNEEKYEILSEELEKLQDVLHEKTRRISSLEKVLGERKSRQIGSHFHEEKILNLKNLEEELNDANELLALKEDELKETRKAHGQRLDRFKTLQRNYSMVSKQLRTYEQHPSPDRSQTEHRRPDPRSLQHENSDAVWNELEYFKKQYMSLKSNRDEIEEEIDALRVENSHHLSTIKQLKIYLQQERNELKTLRSEAKSKERLISPSKLNSLEKQLEILKKKLEHYETTLEEVGAENEALRQKESYYKAEVTSLTDEIDHIHMNIKDRIDAEVQASEFIEGLERQTNRSLDKIAKTIASQTDHQASPVRRRRSDLIEQISQTSPWSPLQRHRRDKIIQSTHSTQTSDNYTSSDDNERADSFLSPANYRSRLKRIRAAKMRTGLVSARDERRVTKDVRSSATKRRKPPGHAMLQKKPKVVLPPKSNPMAREQTSLKLRVLSLQQQVQVLRDSKVKLSQNLIEQQKLNETLKCDLGNAVKKLDMHRMSIEKLSTELEKCTHQRDDLEAELGKERKKFRGPEIGYKDMENRWKLATTECSKLSFQARTLRGENDMMSAKHKEFQERILRLERQLQNKKEIVEELREKLKEQTTTSVKDKDNLDEVKKKNKDLMVKEEQRKTYVEDLRNKINKITTEKLKIQEIYQANLEELNRKSKLLQQSQELCNQAEKAVSEMENAAYTQLQDQAIQHEKLIMKIQKQLNKENQKTKEYQVLIKYFVEEQLKECNRMRTVAYEKRKQRLAEEKILQNEKESMVKARDLACSILDMSSEDLEAFMENEENDNEMIEANDDKFRERLAQCLQKESKFTKPLLTCLLDVTRYSWDLRLQEYQEMNSSCIIAQNQRSN